MKNRPVEKREWVMEVTFISKKGRKTLGASEYLNTTDKHKAAEAFKNFVETVGNFQSATLRRMDC